MTPLEEAASKLSEARNNLKTKLTDAIQQQEKHTFLKHIGRNKEKLTDLINIQEQWNTISQGLSDTEVATSIADHMIARSQQWGELKETLEKSEVIKKGGQDGQSKTYKHLNEAINEVDKAMDNYRAVQKKAEVENQKTALSGAVERVQNEKGYFQQIFETDEKKIKFFRKTLEALFEVEDGQGVSNKHGQFKEYFSSKIERYEDPDVEGFTPTEEAIQQFSELFETRKAFVNDVAEIFNDINKLINAQLDNGMPVDNEQIKAINQHVTTFMTSDFGFSHGKDFQGKLDKMKQGQNEFVNNLNEFKDKLTNDFAQKAEKTQEGPRPGF